MKTLTIFTPTYNRADLLPRLYSSMLDQTSSDFTWLIIDDGSSDGTEQLVGGWIAESKVSIEYIWKPNGGMHTAHNYAYDHISSELNMCMDSDDWLPCDAVESILVSWKRIGDKSGLMGMLGLNVDSGGKVIGKSFPRDVIFCKFDDVYNGLGVEGDKKIVLVTSVAKSFPRYPTFGPEKLVPLSSLYSMLDTRYELCCLNLVWAFVEYQEGGSSATVSSQHVVSPLGFMYSAIVDYKNTRYKLNRFRSLVKILYFEALVAKSGRSCPSSISRPNWSSGNFLSFSLAWVVAKVVSAGIISRSQIVRFSKAFNR